MVNIYYATLGDLAGLREDPYFRKHPGFPFQPLDLSVFDRKELILTDLHGTIYSHRQDKIRDGLLEFLKCYKERNKKIALRSAGPSKEELESISRKHGFRDFLDGFFGDDAIVPAPGDLFTTSRVDLERIAKEMGFSVEQTIHLDEGGWANSGVYYGMDTLVVPDMDNHPEFSFKSLIPNSSS